MRTRRDAAGWLGALVSANAISRIALAFLLSVQAAVVLRPEDVRAQSLLAGEGLGVVVEPLDARSRALGGAGIGLSGWHLLATDPAAGAGLLIPSATATFQSGTTTLTGGGSAGYTRFPTVGASYPIYGNVFSVLLTGFLDQEWQVRSSYMLDVGDREIQTEDVFSSTGSIGRIGVGWARRITESLAVGVTGGSQIGTTERVFTRQLDPDEVGAAVRPFSVGGRLSASGLVAGAGVAWDPSPLLRVAGSFTWADDLVLTPTDDRVGEKGRYRLPLELRVGGTFALTPVLGLHLGLTYADWSKTGEDLSDGSSRGGTWSYGGGLEWGGATFLARTIPFRVGLRHRELPFAFEGAPTAENTLSGGLGFNFLDSENQPLARLELGVERGSRKGGPLSEDFWRVVVSVRAGSG